MISTKEGRMLRVLIIDDRLNDRILSKEASYSSYLEFIPIRSWGEAQAKIAEDAAAEGADVILVDISFDKDPSIRKAASVDEGSVILPVGPMLALPFIGQRAIMACVIYSGHLSQPELHSHPFFLLAMGLIAVRTDGFSRKAPYRSKWLDGIDKPGNLDRKIDEMNSAGTSSVARALRIGLDEYRERLGTLIQDKTVRIMGRAFLDQQLEDLMQACKTGESVKIDRGLSITLTGKNWVDRIALSSLFADKLDNGEGEATVEWIEECRKWLPEAVATNVELAGEIIKLQYEKTDFHVEPADKLIEKRFGDELDIADLTEVLRLVVLFANAWAIIIDKRGTKEAIYTRLGDRIETNRYLQWFGERKGAKKSTKAKTRRSFNWLRPLSVGSDKTDRFYLKSGSVIDAEDAEAISLYLESEGYKDWKKLPFTIKLTGR